MYLKAGQSYEKNGTLIGDFVRFRAFAAQKVCKSNRSLDYLCTEMVSENRKHCIFAIERFASFYNQRIIHQKLKLIHYEEVNDACRHGNFLRQHERAGTSEERMLQEGKNRMLRQEGQERMQERLQERMQERLQAGLRQS
ncbi:MAG: hypothetical protein SO001_07170 [Alloprevotella sp.]|nr:hypothetical protein [Alloprevotella sp.]